MSTMLRGKRRKIPTQEKILQMFVVSDSELCHLSDEDDWPPFQTQKTYLPHVLEGESSLDIKTDLSTYVSAEKTGFGLDDIRHKNLLNTFLRVLK